MRPHEWDYCKIICLKTKLIDSQVMSTQIKWIGSLVAANTKWILAHRVGFYKTIHKKWQLNIKFEVL